MYVHLTLKLKCSVSIHEFALTCRGNDKTKDESDAEMHDVTRPILPQAPAS